MNIAGDRQLGRDLLLHGVRIGLGLEEGPHTGLDLQDLEGLGEIVVAADFETERLVFDFVERTQEHHRDILRRRADRNRRQTS